MSITKRRSRITLSVLCMCAVVAGSLTVGAKVTSAATGPLVYAVNPYGNEAFGHERGLQPFDAFTGEDVGGAQIEVVGGSIPGTVEGATALAVDPTTSVAYAMLRLNDFEQHVLATIDLDSGEAITKGNANQRIAGMTFDAAGNLYGITGPGGGCNSCLVSISKVDGANSLVKNMTKCSVSGQGCGHGLAFNTADGKIYHVTGGDTTPHTFEKTGTAPADPIEQVGLTGTNLPESVLGLGYDAANSRFIATDWNADTFSFSTGEPGVVTQLPATSHYKKGLVVSADPIPADTPPTAVDDAATTAEGQSVTIVVFVNDTDPDGGPIFVDSFTQPANGEVRNNDSSLRYIPEPGYCNDGVTTDAFTYTLNGGSTATVEVTVTCEDFVGPLVFGTQGFGNEPGVFDGGIQAFDAATGRTEFEQVIDAVFPSAITGQVHGAVGLTVDPRTGTTWVLLRMATRPSELVLATIDPLSGEAVTITETDEDIVDMTFSADGNLYAFLGSDVDCQGCLAVLNRTNGSLRVVRTLGGASDSGIAFNPADGRIYRASDTEFQAIAPSKKFAVSDIGYGGLNPNSVLGMGYDPTTGGFIATDNFQEVWLIAANGGASQLSALPLTIHSAVVAEPTLSIRYSAKRRTFSGRLITPAMADCDAGREVTVWRDAATDVEVGVAMTSSSGAYSLKRKGKRGTHFATVGDGPPVSGLPCPEARSRNIKVRPRR